jgi:hypothetical protein
MIKPEKVPVRVCAQVGADTFKPTCTIMHHAGDFLIAAVHSLRTELLLQATQYLETLSHKTPLHATLDWAILPFPVLWMSVVADSHAPVCIL